MSSSSTAAKESAGDCVKNEIDENLSIRWRTFSSCLYVAASCGMSTTFGLFTPSFEDTLHLSPRNIALIGACGNMGNFSGLISGFIIEWLGSHLSLFIAATCVWGGLFSIWLVVMGVIPCSVPVLCCFIYLAQFGGSLTSQTSSSTSLSIFPSLFQYKIASIAKGFSGISGAVISAIAGAYFEDSPNLFILFASAFIPISIFGGAFVVPDIPPNGREHFKEPTLTISQRITPYYYHFICLLLSSIVTALLPLFSVPYLPIISKVCGTFMVVWLALIFIVPSYLYITNFHAKFQKIISSYLSWIGSERYTSVPDSTHSTTVTSDDQVVNPVIEMRNLEDGTENNSWSNIQTTEQSIPSKYPNYNVLQMIQTPEFWLIISVQSLHYGGTLMIINLIEPITTSFGVKFSSFYVFLIGSSSSVGRICSAHLLQALSDYFTSTLTPEHLMGYCCLSVSLLNLLYSLYIPSSILLGVLIACTGFLYGIMGVLSASSVVSMFGVAHVATNDGVYDLSGAIGAYLIAYGVIALFTASSQDDYCVGSHCYQNCFFLTSALCLFGFILSRFIHR